MTPAVKPVQTRSATDLVTEELRRSIIAGDLAPGSSFSLRTIADMLGVSFIPVREALRNLEAEQLVITRPGKSATVAPLDLDELKSIYRFRLWLEPELAARSCTLISAAELDRLESVARGFETHYADMQEYYDSHHKFHADLLAPAATNWEKRFLTSTWRSAERYIRIGFHDIENRVDERHKRLHRHVALVDAFRSGDPDQASRAVHEHLSGNVDAVLAALKSHQEAQGSQRAHGG